MRPVRPSGGLRLWALHPEVARWPTSSPITATTTPHLVCTRCGSASEVPPELLARATQAALAEHGFGVSVHRSPLYGTCAACRRA